MAGTVSYSFDIRDDEGFALAIDEPEIAYEIVEEVGSARLEVTAVLVEPVAIVEGRLIRKPRLDLLDPHIAERPFLKILGIEIKAEVESDRSWCSARLSEHGFGMAGAGWGDPETRTILMDRAS